jgi:hypothetical protein
VSRGRQRLGDPTPAELGLPEHSALTIEGRIERAGMVGAHLVRSRGGHERPVWRSNWAMGLWLILAVLATVIVVIVVVSVL